MKRPSYRLLILSVCLLQSAITYASPEIGAMAGVSSSNVQVPSRIYHQASLLFGAEVTFETTDVVRAGAFWEANSLTARSGQPAPFDTGGDVTGLAHFFGGLLRFRPMSDTPIFVDMKLGLNARSIGAPAPASDLAPGLGAAIGYRFDVAPGFALSPRLGYRILSYSVQNAAHYAHQGYDVNLLVGFSL